MHICGMRWQTTTQLPSFPFHINHGEAILLMGSCFAENIGERLSRYKFKTVQNPFGIVYNPLSLAETVSFLCGDKTFTENNLNYSNNLYFSYMHHSRFSGVVKTEVLQNMNEKLAEARASLKNQKAAFISLGTAFYWVLNQTDQAVNNCHKQPSKLFTQKRASVNEVTQALLKTIHALRSKNASLQIVFTISPIRHLKHGSAQNQLSKATLLVAAHTLAEEFDFVHYFPSYELLLDDLRDYRFYNEDLIHPNKIAVDYIWEAFTRCFFSEETQQILPKIEKIKQLISHRLMHATDEKRLELSNKIIQNIDALKNVVDVDFMSEWLLWSKQNS